MLLDLSASLAAFSSSIHSFVRFGFDLPSGIGRGTRLAVGSLVAALSVRSATSSGESAGRFCRLSSGIVTWSWIRSRFTPGRVGESFWDVTWVSARLGGSGFLFFDWRL